MLKSYSPKKMFEAFQDFGNDIHVVDSGAVTVIMNQQGGNILNQYLANTFGISQCVRY